MVSTQSSQPSTASQSSNNVEQHLSVMLKQPASAKIQPPAKRPLTFGQKVADAMATKVGSWAFLIGQTTVLTGWVTANMMPGIPHWDEAPFMMLNLMFSFASAYTAPVVLMSQNRQSEEDRESANHNYQVTVQAAQNLELLHEKLDAQYSGKLDELTTLIKQQQQTTNQTKVVFVPTQLMHEFEHSSNAIAKTLLHNTHPKDTVLVNIGTVPGVDSEFNLDDVQVWISK